MRSSFRARRYTLPLTRGPLSLEGNKTEQNACQLCILQDLCITEKYLFQWLGEGLWGDIRWSWLEKDCFSHCSEWAFVWGLILSAVTRFFFFFPFLSHWKGIVVLHLKDEKVIFKNEQSVDLNRAVPITWPSHTDSPAFSLLFMGLVCGINSQMLTSSAESSSQLPRYTGSTVT